MRFELIDSKFRIFVFDLSNQNMNKASYSDRLICGLQVLLLTPLIVYYGIKYFMKSNKKH